MPEKLRIRLTGAEKKRLRKKSTDNTAAYQLYLKGRYQWNKRTEESLKRGIAHFEEAIESDPSFAGAYAGLADSYLTLATNIPLPPREAMPKAKAAASRALEIDGALAEAWASLAAVKWWYEWDWDGAEAAYKSAIKLNPNYATAHDGYAMLLCARGRFDASLEQVRKAVELDPLSRIIAVHAGWPFYFARDYESAIGRFEKALELDDKFIPAQAWRAMALGQQHRHEESVAAFQRALETERIPILLAMLGHTRAIAGQRAEAEMILSMLAEQAKTRYISPYDIAVIHAGLGDRAAALAKLEEAYEDRSAWMVFIDVDPRLDALRDEAQFQELAARLQGLGPSYRKRPDSISRVFDDDDRAALEIRNDLGQHGVEAPDEKTASGIAHSGGDRADDLAAAEAQDFAEIEVDGDDDSLLGVSFGEDLLVRQSLKMFVAQMDRVVSPLSQPPVDVDAGVNEKTHQPLWTSSRVSHAAYSTAARTSSSPRSGYARMTSSADAPCAIWARIAETGMPMPRMQARPPMIRGSNVMRSNIV